jgi:uncharacterized membrane protein YfcA
MTSRKVSPLPEFARYGLLCLLVFTTYFQEAVTGFGCTVLALPFAILLLGGVADAKAVLVMLALVLNCGVSILAKKHIVWKEVVIILVLVIIGLPVGMLLADKLPEEFLKLILAAFMVVIGLQGLIALGDGVSKRANRRTRILASGFLPIGGIIHGAFASGGPLVVIYATKALADKSVFRVTLAMSFVLINSALVTTLAVQHVITPRHVYLAAMCLPFILAGLFIGDRVHYKLPELAFKRMVYGVLVAAGVALGWVALAAK